MTIAVDKHNFRRKVLLSFSASEVECRELLLYNENMFHHTDMPDFPLPDELFVRDWQIYADQCKESGSILPLQSHLIQLRFPIQKGISQTADYIAATRQGVDPGERLDSCIQMLVAPDKVGLTIHSTPAGRIPILVAEIREDFVTLVQAISRRNEPVPVSESMGACIIGSYNNWSRMRVHLSRLEADSPVACDYDRRQAFQRVAADKALYQDRFILLSSGAYSSVNAERLGLQDEEWKRLSLVIRREHECAHYFTRRIYGSMRNNVLDELIADFAGITAATGTFKASWFLHFIGLEDFSRYRPGARLENYRGTPPLSDGAFAVLQKVLRSAVENLERFAQRHGDLVKDPQLKSRLLAVLSCFTIEELSSDQGDSLLARALSGLHEKTLTG